MDIASRLQSNALVDWVAELGLIIEHLERGTAPWHCSWQRDVGIPRNFQTGKAYSGINVLLLGFRHQPSRWWLTFQQALERGGHVRKPMIRCKRSGCSSGNTPSSMPLRSTTSSSLELLSVFESLMASFGLWMDESPTFTHFGLIPFMKKHRGVGAGLELHGMNT